ncbi:MAG: DUF664 domain-containing protein [Nocardioidaceae bacterium]
MTLRFPSPTVPIDDRRQVLLGYLDYFRSVVTDRLTGVDEAWLRESRLPSGWAPLELLKHLVYMEQRWLVWGFVGQDVADPWGDNHDGRWRVDDDETPAVLMDQLHQGGRRTRAIVEAHTLADVGAPGERWDGEPPAPLERVLLHVIQEYARHAGHLDIVRELVDGHTGE